jgi:ribosome biogenesis protein BMS1
MMVKKKRPGLLQRRAVAMEPQERKVHSLIQAINTINNIKESKRREKKVEDRKKHAKELAKKNAETEARQKERSKEYFRKEGQKRKAQSKTGSGSFSKKRKTA